MNDGLKYAAINGINDGMQTTVTLDSAGRFVLPKEFRRQLKLGAGSRLRADIVADRIELTPEPDDGARVVRRGGRAVLTGLGKSFDASGAVGAEREGRLEVLAKRLKFK